MGRQGLRGGRAGEEAAVPSGGRAQTYLVRSVVKPMEAQVPLGKRGRCREAEGALAPGPGPADCEIAGVKPPESLAEVKDTEHVACIPWAIILGH